MMQYVMQRFSLPEVAVFSEGIWSMPDHADQIATIDAGNAFSILSDMAVIHITGDDAAVFLQGQFSCDVQAVSESRATWGSYSTAKGRALATFLLMKASDGFLLLIKQSLAEGFCKRLKMFVMRSKVVLTQVTGWHVVLVHSTEVSAGDAVTVSQIVTGGWQLDIAPKLALFVLPADGVAAPDILTGKQFVGTRMAELMFIRAGLPWLTSATLEQFVPQMLNLDVLGGISFKKGCYPGQEIVARTQYLGKVKRRLYRLQVNAGSVTAGDVIIAAQTGDQGIGMIVSAVALRPGEFECLAVLQSAAWEDNPHLQSDSSSVLTRLVLPYSMPDES